MCVVFFFEERFQSKLLRNVSVVGFSPVLSFMYYFQMDDLAE